MNARKEMFEGKKRYAQRKAAENAEIASENGLTDEQIDALDSLCSFRHWLHCNSDRAANEESPEYSEIAKECSEYWEDEDGTQRATIKRLFGEYPFSRRDWNSINDWRDLIDQEETLKEMGMEGVDPDSDEAYEAWIGYCYTTNAKIFEKINDEIEAFLKKVDEKYGTNYCPTGISRLY